MAVQDPQPVDAFSRWDAGILDYPKENNNAGYVFGRSINYRTDPKKLTLLPKTTKESGTIITDLPKDGDLVGTTLYYYGDTGNIYKRTSAGSHSLLRSVAGSHGNGMRYYGEDDFLYYTTDTTIGRYGQIGGTPTFVDDFLGAEGGVPQNTSSIDLESGSSQYASRADTASLSITGDLCIEGYIKPESLPTTGNSMVLFSKWDVNTNLRSYKLEIYAVSGYFGDGSDSSLTISSDTTEAPIDSACTGTSGTHSLSATNVSFAAGQIIFIHQSQGTGAGTWQRNKIASYTAGTITTEDALNATYTSGAQVRVLKQYTNVTINSGKTYSAKAWNGTVGGILAFLANGTVTVNGSISASQKGFIGGQTTAFSSTGGSGEGTAGVGVTNSTAANGNGGGGGGLGTGGAGGGNGTVGTSSGGTGGSAAGTADLTTIVFGGGSGSCDDNSSGAGAAANGATGGGIIFVSSVTFTMGGSSTIASAGGNGASPNSGNHGGAGGGAGGSVLIKAQTATLGTGLITAAGGTGGAPSGSGTAGGAGAVGRIHLDYYTSYTGTTSPTLDVTQDNTLVTTTTYQLRLGLSSNGTAEEFLTKATTITTAMWVHVAVSWDASTSTATFFQDGVSLGTSVGAVTSLNNNASVAGLGADFNSTARNFFDGLMNNFRIWNTERTTSQIYNNKDVYIADNSTGLVAWYKLNGDATDSQTAGNNDLTESGTPTYSSSVPYSAATTRRDLDQSLDTSGNTYTTPTSISETATNRQTFVPNKDPQKSVEVLVAAIGTGNWTLTVHDSLNRTVASATVTNANMHTGDYEFVFSSVWRPIRGASYHFHITSTVNDGTVTTTTVSDLETVDFHTYYQFLVDDADYHPIEQILNFIGIGNERYLATYDSAGTYTPHRLVFPSGWKVRCITPFRGFWAIGCWKGSDITQTDEGRIFFWDGISDTYFDSIPVPEGAVNAMYAYKGKLYIWAGYHGERFVYEGGDSTNDNLKQQVPLIADDEYIEILPKAVRSWDGLLRWGVGGISNSNNVERGVYTEGRKYPFSPDSLSYDYPISTGSRATTNVKIGFIYPVAQKLLIGWKDNVSYGMDVVDPTGDCFASGTVEEPKRDYGRVSKKKLALVARAECKPLTSGQQIRVKYKYDDDTNWTASDWEDTVGSTEVRLPLANNAEFRELEVACDIETTSGVSPTILEVGSKSDMKPTELQY